VLEQGMDTTSQAVVGSGPIGLFAYGVLNRILIVTGLHHIINNVAWFLLGDFNGVTGDLKRFFAGDPTAGFFMSGFFPVMMFGLPAACLAMYRTARPERRRETGGLLVSMSLTSFLTGVTEPIEFSFMFLAPALYLLHALLTGTALVLMYWLDCRLGFSFSAGLFDYILNFKNAEHPLYLLPVGAAYFAVYYGVFRYCIVRFDLKTPGRDPAEAATPHALPAAGTGGLGPDFVAALGGAPNLLSVDACTTRLRLTLADPAKIDEPALKRLGSRGLLRLGEQNLQVVLGPIADQVAGEIRDALHAVPATTSTRTTAPIAVAARAASGLAEALGGEANIESLELAGGRLLLRLRDAGAVRAEALQALGVRAIASLDAQRLHLLHPRAESLLVRA
jgi:PTS system N-acetylglucosamine-specific IIC component